jgi:hypothetical protein
MSTDGTAMFSFGAMTGQPQTPIFFETMIFDALTRSIRIAARHATEPWPNM